MRRPLAIAVFALLSLSAVAAPGALRAFYYRHLDPPPAQPLAPVEGVGGHSAAACGACHAEIYQEWAGSMMGRAMTDPVFVADWQHQGESGWCLRCHAPLQDQQPVLEDGFSSLQPLAVSGPPNPDFDPALQDEGVTCVACHLQEGALVGPIADPQGAPHPTRYEPDLGSAGCEGCHQLAAPPLSGLDRPLADVHREWDRWRAATGRSETCAGCHMPEVERPAAAGGPVRVGRRHTFGGAWDDAVLRGGVTLLEADRAEGGLRVRIRNEAGHNNPTGDPARALVIAGSLSGAEGPIAAGEVVLARLIPLPKLRDEGDTTLLPGETRDVVIPFSDEELRRARGAQIEVRYQRLRYLEAIADAAGIPAEDREVTLVTRELSW